MAAPALAARDILPDDDARLRKGEVLVASDRTRDGFEYIWAAEDIQAPPETVWSVLNDCKAAVGYVWRLRTCKVVQADPAGRWDMREQKLTNLPLIADIDVTFRNDYDRPRSVRFVQVAGDLGGSTGEWRLLPLDGGQGTRLIYEGRIGLPEGIMFTGSLVRVVIHSDTKDALKGLRKRSVKIAVQGSPAPH